MTRIVFFDGYPHAYAGAQRATRASARGLRDAGWNVTVVLPAEGLFAARLREDGLPVRIVSAPEVLLRYGHHDGAIPWWRTAIIATPAMLRYWWILRHAMRDNDLLHVNDHRGLVLAAPAARLAGVPVVWHTHGVLPPKVLNRLGRRLARRTIVLSEADARQLPSNRTRPRPDVVPNATDEGFFDMPRLRSDSPIVVTTARLNKIKGIDVLLRAMALVRERRPDVSAVVLGSVQLGHTDDAEEFARLQRDLALEDTVTFAGYVERPEIILATAAVYVQPSRWEGVPMGALEAMAMGLPVVATRVGGLPEVIEHGVTGLLVTPDDPEALASAIIEVVESPDQGARLGAAARAWAQRNHSADVSLARLIDVYAAALA